MTRYKEEKSARRRFRELKRRLKPFTIEVRDLLEEPPEDVEVLTASNLSGLVCHVRHFIPFFRQLREKVKRTGFVNRSKTMPWMQQLLSRVL